jgi:hypothetical protein
MRALSLALLVLIGGVAPSVSQTTSHPETRYFASDCSDVAKAASTYLSSRGIFVDEGRHAHDLAILGIDHEPLETGKVETKQKKWTDAQGNRVTDLKVYWTYADKSTGDKPVFGIWRLRLAHYQPRGEIKLAQAEGGGCSVDFDLYFETWGANVIGILPVDSQWGYHSNGLMEREYLGGISAALTEGKAWLRKP